MIEREESSGRARRWIDRQQAVARHDQLQLLELLGVGCERETRDHEARPPPALSRASECNDSAEAPTRAAARPK